MLLAARRLHLTMGIDQGGPRPGCVVSSLVYLRSPAQRSTVPLITNVSATRDDAGCWAALQGKKELQPRADSRPDRDGGKTSDCLIKERIKGWRPEGRLADGELQGELSTAPSITWLQAASPTAPFGRGQRQGRAAGTATAIGRRRTQRESRRARDAAGAMHIFSAAGQNLGSRRPRHSVTLVPEEGDWKERSG